jgi:hypothetical protein
MKKLIKLVSEVDLFGSPVHFRINSKTSSKTFFGGLLTSIFMSAITVIGLINLEISLNHKSPYSSKSQKLNDNPEVTINSLICPFAFFITDERNNVIPQNTMKELFSVKLVHYNPKNITGQNVALEPCTENHFPNLGNANFHSNILLSNSLCPKINNYLIRGSWDQPELLTFLSLELFPCQNSTYNNFKCPTIEEIKKNINKELLYANIILLNEELDVIQFKDYSIYSKIQIYKAIMPSVRKYIEVYLSEVKFTTDKGFFLEIKNEYNTAQLDSIVYDQSEYIIGSSFIKIDFYASKNRLEYYRSYMKLLEILAGLGGMSKSLQIIFSCMAYFYSNLKKDEHLLNKIFDFDIIYQKHSKNNQIDRKKFVDTSRIDLNTKRRKKPYFRVNVPVKSSYTKVEYPAPKEEDITLRSVRNVVMNNENLKDIIKLIKTKSHPIKTLKLRFGEYIGYMLFRPCVSKVTKNKFNLYIKSNQILASILDISYIIEKLEELEKMKILLFSKEQVALFGFLLNVH